MIKLPKPVTWSRFPSGETLTILLCYNHYMLGKLRDDPDMGHEHWVLPANEKKSERCIICYVAELEAEIAELKQQL